jgi:hypothetical protein
MLEGHCLTSDDSDGNNQNKKRQAEPGPVNGAAAFEEGRLLHIGGMG